MNGKIFLIPVTLGGDDFKKVIPEGVLDITRSLRVFVVENIRSARRYLRLIDKAFPIDESVFFELSEHTVDHEIAEFLDPVLAGRDMGIMSEAGLPAIADPGAKLIAMAQMKKIQVVPLSGPSSIIMALISSGLNGQNFTFNGYLPIQPSERASKVKELERRSGEGSAQIFMETPYRNQKMIESVLATCHNETLLCIATDISLPSESIKTMPVAEWRKEIPVISGKLAVFILQRPAISRY